MRVRSLAWFGMLSCFFVDRCWFWSWFRFDGLLFSRVCVLFGFNMRSNFRFLDTRLGSFVSALGFVSAFGCMASVAAVITLRLVSSAFCALIAFIVVTALLWTPLRTLTVATVSAIRRAFILVISVALISAATLPPTTLLVTTTWALTAFGPIASRRASMIIATPLKDLFVEWRTGPCATVPGVALRARQGYSTCGCAVFWETTSVGDRSPDPFSWASKTVTKRKISDGWAHP